jgi:hypothetical protein
VLDQLGEWIADGAAKSWFAVFVAESPRSSRAELDAAALAATGALTQKAGTAGCISETGTGGECADGTALVGAFSVTVAPFGSV